MIPNFIRVHICQEETIFQRSIDGNKGDILDIGNKEFFKINKYSSIWWQTYYLCIYNAYKYNKINITGG